MNFIMSLLSFAMFNFSGISDCGVKPLFSITSQSFEPNGPKSGDNVSWTINYKVPDGVEIKTATSINSGTINGFLPIEPTESDLCEIVECPILPGEYSSTSFQIWPDGLTGTKLSLISQWVDDLNNELLCSKVSVIGQRRLRGSK
jgi:hypothetical protein